ncbi:hypothetical protein C0J52_17254 [Blattella germanica]|nr:hypothetical protein C0J52_17254 [Blattella germanica]
MNQREGINAYAYADDIVVGSKDITKLQETMDIVEKWCTKHKFEINVKKTQMMIFRNGGRTPKAAEICIQNKKLKIVPDYKYLGMTLQTSARSYSKHIAERATQAVRAMHDVQKVKSLSIKTAMALFKSKIMPILTYGLEIIWEKLSMANLKTIEKVKATYLKKAIGVSKNTRSRLVYLLARETFLIEDLRMTMTLPRTNASEQLLTILREKREATPEEFYGTGAMIDREWTKENFELRHGGRIIPSRVRKPPSIHLGRKRVKFRRQGLSMPHIAGEPSEMGTAVFVSHLPVDIPELRARIISSFEQIYRDMLCRVWDELDYRLEVYRITTGECMEYLEENLRGMMYMDEAPLRLITFNFPVYNHRLLRMITFLPHSFKSLASKPNPRPPLFEFFESCLVFRLAYPSPVSGHFSDAGNPPTSITRCNKEELSRGSHYSAWKNPVTAKHLQIPKTIINLFLLRIVNCETPFKASQLTGSNNIYNNISGITGNETSDITPPPHPPPPKPCETNVSLVQCDELQFYIMLLSCQFHSIDTNRLSLVLDISKQKIKGPLPTQIRFKTTKLVVGNAHSTVHFYTVPVISIGMGTSPYAGDLQHNQGEPQRFVLNQIKKKYLKLRNAIAVILRKTSSILFQCEIHRTKRPFTSVFLTTFANLQATRDRKLNERFWCYRSKSRHELCTSAAAGLKSEEQAFVIENPEQSFRLMDSWNLNSASNGMSLHHTRKTRHLGYVSSRHSEGYARYQESRRAKEEESGEALWLPERRRLEPHCSQRLLPKSAADTRQTPATLGSTRRLSSSKLATDYLPLLCQDYINLTQSHFNQTSSALTRQPYEGPSHFCLSV